MRCQRARILDRGKCFECGTHSKGLTATSLPDFEHDKIVVRVKMHGMVAPSAIAQPANQHLMIAWSANTHAASNFRKTRKPNCGHRNPSNE
jgi:hypothetical protein